MASKKVPCGIYMALSSLPSVLLSLSLDMGARYLSPDIGIGVRYHRLRNVVDVMY